MSKKSNFAFILRDEQQGIEALVYALEQDNTLYVRSSQPLGGIKYLVMSMYLSYYGLQRGIDYDGYGIDYKEGDQDSVLSYANFLADTNEEDVRAVTKSVDQLVYHFHKYRTKKEKTEVKPVERKPSGIVGNPVSDEYVPDFEHMTDSAWLEWEKYFLGGIKDENL